MTAATPRALEKFLRGLYLGLPLGWSTRLRIKRAVFSWLAPVLSGTGMHHRWQAAEAERARADELARSQAALSALDAIPLQRRRPGTGAGPGAPRSPFGRTLGQKLVLVVHDAHPHGAQYLALNLLDALVHDVGVDVRVLLLGPGPLAPAFEALAPVQAVDAGDAAAVQALAARLRADGYGAALVNSLASGGVVRALSGAGLRVVTLVHEMPGIIRAHRLEPALADVMANSAHVVVSSQDVADGLRGFVDPAALDAIRVDLPQGLYVRNPHYGGRERGPAARRLRERLGLAQDSRVVLAVGYADARKGVDLFAQALARLAGRDARVHGVWVGHQDAAHADAARATLAAAGLAGHLHFPGLDFDTDDYYAGADVYALASREDPFPSVLLEALSVGTPAVAFAGTGGGARLLEHIGAATVPAFDVAAFADALQALLDDPARHARQAARGFAEVEQAHCFRRYTLDLLALAGLRVPRVSVVVPNFNYARYLRARLASIATQDLPVYELIVLDDASTDDSAAVLEALRAETTPAPRLQLASANGGSVFRQWAAGVALARGDFVWIAEADDLAEPGFLAALAPALQQDASLAMACCQSRPIDAQGRILAPDYAGWTDDLSAARWQAPFTSTGREEVQAGLGDRNTIPNVSAVLFRREVLARVLDEHLDEIAAYTSAGDWVTYLRVLQHGRLRFDPRPLNLHRRHEGSVVAAQDADAALREVRGVQALARRLHAAGDDTTGPARDENEHELKGDPG